ncbi:MAG: prephenate dehydrogenase/arogenate dehydrogenase family protein [Gemmatimonadaceae bacterium]|nr:prephenate dehydrogenase/arogenate dehydrogenase family protein [Gemmatimonadaceae bacterium]
MIPTQTVAIIGLGLMGGALARDAAAAGLRVLAHDRVAARMAAAQAAGVVAAPLADDLAGVEAADVVVLAVPVLAAPPLLATLAPRLRAGTAVTDVGSTKLAVVAEASRLGLGPRFVGAHPMCGDHRNGWEASRPGLYRDALVYVCPAAADADAVARVEALWQAVGARPTRMDAAAHDALLAWTSHLPQFASSALAATLADAGIGRDRLGPGGRDATRLAGSAPEVWTPIALANAAALAPAVRALAERLATAADAIATGDATALARLLGDARDWSAADDAPRMP